VQRRHGAVLVVAAQPVALAVVDQREVGGGTGDMRQLAQVVVGGGDDAGGTSAAQLVAVPVRGVRGHGRVAATGGSGADAPGARTRLRARRTPN
jgi:hypothetical protein